MRIEITHSSEGPRHDPYNVDEVTVTRRNGCRVTFRNGSLSGESVRVVRGGKRKTRGIRTYDCSSSETLHAIFLQHAGITVKAAVRAYRKLRERCRDCGDTRTRSVSGFPGETFEICVGCGHVVDSQFDLSAVE